MILLEVLHLFACVCVCIELFIIAMILACAGSSVLPDLNEYCGENPSLSHAVPLVP